MYYHDDEKDNVEDVDDYHDDEQEQYILNDDLVTFLRFIIIMMR